MKNFILNHRSLTLIVGLLIILTVLLILNSGAKNLSPMPTPNPANAPNRPAANGGVTFTNTSQDQQQKTIGYNVTELIKKLPYSGSNFSLTYDFVTNSFTVTFRSASLEAGQQEFKTFLSRNGIPDQSGLQNLTTKYQ